MTSGIQNTKNLVTDQLVRELVNEYLINGWVSSDIIDTLSTNGFTRNQAEQLFVYIWGFHRQLPVDMPNMSLFFGVLAVVHEFMLESGEVLDHVIPDLMTVGISEEAAYAMTKLVAFLFGHDLTYLNGWSIIETSDEDLPEFFSSSLH